MEVKLLVFDSHPVQYRVPIWQAIEQLQPGCLHVAYASDCSVKGHLDEGFGKTFAWDEPMLKGYGYSILNSENGVPLSGWGSLTGNGVKATLKKHMPQAVLLTGLNYKYDAVAYFEAKKMGIPVWLRCENQDQAFYRGKLKSVLRDILFSSIYAGIRRFFFIGELNKQHYLDHGVAVKKLRPARYCTIDRYINLSPSKNDSLRNESRSAARITNGSLVVGFSGKLIDKKNPDIIFDMVSYLPAEIRNKLHLYFLGSGNLEAELKMQSELIENQFGVKTYFAGFVNQSQIAAHYLAMDIMVLPSRRMGETWGLVANEAMQAGCGVIVSDAVGCSRDFETWERFRVFNEQDPRALANKVEELANFTRNVSWATIKLEDYSVNATAKSIIAELI